MTTKFSLKEVQKIARLSSLELTEKENGSFCRTVFWDYGIL